MDDHENATTSLRTSANSFSGNKETHHKKIVSGNWQKRSSGNLSFQSRSGVQYGNHHRESCGSNTDSSSQARLSNSTNFKSSTTMGKVEKPTILIYPRKSVVVSTPSLACGMNDDHQDDGGVMDRSTSISSVGMSSSNLVTGMVGGVHKSKSSWSVKGSGGLRSGMVSSRSMGSVRHPRGPEKRSMQQIAVGEWEYEQAEKQGDASKASQTVTSPVGSLGSVRFADQVLSVRESIAEEESEYRPSTSDDSHLRDSSAQQQPSGLKLPTTEHQDGSRPVSAVGEIDEGYRDNPDYYEYLLLSQRHASSNFITKLDSADVVYPTEAAPVKVIGPYVLGDKIGKGSFGKVKEGLCSETLQRVAVKIINKKRLRKVQHGIENVLRYYISHYMFVRFAANFCVVEKLSY
jgi:hypothetical protein